MNGLIDIDSESDRRQEPNHLKLVEMLIDKIIKRLEDDSFEPRVQDALKAIQLKQKLVKTSEAEKTFWQEIDDIRRSELERQESLESQTENLQAQILRTMMRLKYEVKNGLLPVKTITDTHNQGKSKECHLTYQRIGRLLSTMGFQKGKAGNNSAILWNEEKIDQIVETFLPSPHREDGSTSLPSTLLRDSERSRTVTVLSPSKERTLYSPSLDGRG